MLQIHVNTANNLPLSPTHRTAIEEHLSEALSKVELAVNTINVFLTDVHSVSGQAGISCRMVADIPACPTLTAEETAPSIELAAAITAEELIGRIRKYWQRRHSLSRHEAATFVAPPVDAIDAAEIVAALPH